MTAVPPLVPALGGTRRIPAPDPIAADYLLLGSRFDQHLPGLVDGYFGPADLKAQADTEQLRAPRRLLEDVAGLRERLATEVEDAARRDWLAAQLDALEAHALAISGEPLPYLEYVTRCMGFIPRGHPDTDFDAAAAAIDDLLPGPGPLADRLETWDERTAIPSERLSAVAAWLIDVFRRRAARDFGLPDGETLKLELVNDRPWIAYDWYLGGRRSRVEINTDLPVTAHELIVTLGHEAYPGHHLEGVWREVDHVESGTRLEASMILANTPEGPISEGLARYGTRFASPLEDRADLLVELYERAGLSLAADPVEARDVAARTVRLAAPRDRLESATDEAALRLHAEGRPRAEVIAYLREVGRYPEAVATQRLAFIEDPSSRLYVFAYDGGEAIVGAWVEKAEAPDPVERFGRLLHGPVTPGRLLAELA